MAGRRTAGVAAPWGFPTAFLIRLLRGVLILAIVLLTVPAAIGVFLTYRIITARNDTEVVTPSSYLLSNYVTLNFFDRLDGEHEGWLLLGLRGAPVIILCHGYNSNRSELLSLGTVLRENHFNVYLFNFRSSKAKTPFSNLGVQQAANVLGAIAAVTKQPAVNPRRLGLFGTTTGGYAALVAAQQSSLVKALVVDTVYEKPDQMFEAELNRRLGGSSPMFRILAETEFHLFTLGTQAPAVRENLRKLDNIPTFFIWGKESPLLAAATEDLFNRAPQPRRALVLEHSQTAQTSGAEKKEYENQVLNFFLQNLPLRAD